MRFSVLIINEKVAVIILSFISNGFI